MSEVEEDKRCNNCGKEITWDTWVINWGTCDECFDHAYEAYMQRVKAKDTPLEKDEEDVGF